MDPEDKARLMTLAGNLSDASTITEWKTFIRHIGEMYKKALPETLSGGTLTTEIAAAEVDIAALIAEMDARTELGLK